MGSGPLNDFRRENPDIIHAIVEQRWFAELTPKNHIRFTSPTGRSVFHSGSSSDWRAVKNLRAQLRRAGLNLGRR